MTARRFAFLRAINTGGRRLTNDELLEPFRRLGLDDVAAHQAAGNVVFRSDEAAAVLEARIEAALRESFGFEATTFVRSPAELRSVVDEQPFPDDVVSATEGRIQVTFLRSPVTDSESREVDALVPDDDLVELCPRHWYWLPRTGVSGSSLPVARIETVLGPMTMRTLGTVERMLTRFAPDA